MTKSQLLYEQLTQECDWQTFLRANSCLPGPRANLELIDAVVRAGDRAFFEACLAADVPSAVPNTPDEFLVICGVVGLGAELARGEQDVLPILRRYAVDPRWRLREAVAMALQRWGDVDFNALLVEMKGWVVDDPLQSRAAAAALCEPRLLVEADRVMAVFDLLDKAMEVLRRTLPTNREGRDVLIKGLSYCYSVAVVALPEPGKDRLARWAYENDKTMRRVVRNNLHKNRLQRLDPDWVERLNKSLETQ